MGTFTGMLLKDALDELERRDVKHTLAYTTADDTRKHHVILGFPDLWELEFNDQPVHLLVSSAQIMPNVLGQTVEEINETLTKQLGWKVDIVEGDDSELDKGLCSQTNPRAGAQFDAFLDGVEVRISNGRKKAKKNQIVTAGIVTLNSIKCVASDGGEGVGSWKEGDIIIKYSVDGAREQHLFSSSMYVGTARTIPPRDILFKKSLSVRLIEDDWPDADDNLGTHIITLQNVSDKEHVYELGNPSGRVREPGVKPHTVHEKWVLRWSHKVHNEIV